MQLRGAQVKADNSGLTVISHPDFSNDFEVNIVQDFIGYVDECSQTKAGNYRISGWALENKALRPPLCVMVLRDDMIVSTHRVMHVRPDVTAAFPQLNDTSQCGFTFDTPLENLVNAQLMLLSGQGHAYRLPRIEIGASFAP